MNADDLEMLIVHIQSALDQIEKVAELEYDAFLSTGKTGRIDDTMYMALVMAKELRSELYDLG